MIKQPKVIDYMDDFIDSIFGNKVRQIWLTRSQWNEYSVYCRECRNNQYRQETVKPFIYRGRRLRSTSRVSM